MKYSKIALVLLGLAWLLLITLLGNPLGWHLSPSAGNSLIYSCTSSFLLSIILASVGKAKEKTTFTKVAFILSLVSIVLLFLALILYGRGIGSQF